MGIGTVTNEDRAGEGYEALLTYILRTRLAPDPTKVPVREALGDLMCDLLHTARYHGIDPEELMANAKGMFETEEREDD